MTSTGVAVHDVAVIGGGVAGLTAARDLAAGGLDVVVLEGRGRAGGCVASIDVAGVRLDAAAESFAVRAPDLLGLLDELGLGDAVVRPRPGGAWVHHAHGAAPLPRHASMGIPADLDDPALRRVLGRLGVARARLDRVLPGRVGTRPGTTLARLVRARMGRRVLDRLVAPVTTGVVSTDPSRIEADALLPGLCERTRATGSLAGAVAAGLTRPGVPAGGAVAGLDGGVHTLVAALLDALGSAGVEVRTHAPVRRVRPVEQGWELEVVAEVDGASGADGDADRSQHVVRARRVLLAVPGDAARRLLDGVGAATGTTPHLPTAPAPHGAPPVVLVTLVLEAPALDDAPRGTGVLVAPGVPGVVAKALTHVTAKWEWAAQALAEQGPGGHVVRLSYGRGGEPVTALAGTGAALVDQALADAGALLGCTLTRTQLLGSAVTRWPALGSPDRPDALRAQAAALTGIDVCGGALVRPGLLAVVIDARAAAGRILATSHAQAPELS